MAEWAMAAEMQLDLRHWLESENGRRWGRVWVNSVSAEETGRKDLYEALILAEAQKLLTADAIWVSPDMCQVVQAARDGFQPEPLEMADFIVPTGFLYFSDPIYMLDRHRRTVSVGGISWCPFIVEEHGNVTDVHGMTLTLYTSALAPEDEFRDAHRRLMKDYGAPALTPMHMTIVRFGEQIDRGDLEDDLGQYTGADQWWKTLQTALRLMQQRISTRTDTPLPRSTRRRYKRSGVEVKEMLVIRLRRPVTKRHDESLHPVEWTHRWIVDGFWRSQYYPSLGRHRQIYIAPYVKGPEDKELIIKKRFFKWDR